MTIELFINLRDVCMTQIIMLERMNRHQYILEKTKKLQEPVYLGEDPEI